MATEIALIEMPEDRALEVFIAPKGLDPYLDKIAAEARSLVPDVSTKKGRDAIASNAHKVAKSKTALDNVRKKLADWLKEKPKLVDAEGKRMRDFLDALKDEVRKPLTEWEEQEEARIAGHQLSIKNLQSFTDVLAPESSAFLLKELLGSAEVFDTSRLEEFETEALRLKEHVVNTLRDALAAREQYESDQAELAKLRAEAAEREQKEREAQAERDRIAAEEKAKAAQAERERVAAENARIAAELRAEADRARADAQAKAEIEAATRRELEAKEAAERAETARIAAENRAEADRIAAADKAQRDQAAAVKAEQDRQAAEAKRIADDLAKRERDTAHKKKINNAAVDALRDNGIDSETAMKVIKLIIKKQVPNVAINY